MKSIVFACVFGTAMIAASMANAQSGKFASTGTTTKLAKKVGFRLTQWKTIQSNNNQQALDNLKVLRQIGCEVQQSAQGDQIDIKFRCPNWKIIETGDEQKSMQWQDWLMMNNFETVVVNPDVNTKLPTVRMRLAQWKTIHTHDTTQLNQLQRTLDLIGCEVTSNNHGNHIDLKYRMANWNTIGLANEEAAHIWLNWLKKSGFETQHEHK